jgi:hypothetical protein
VLEFCPYTDEFYEDLSPFFRRLREGAPLSLDEKMGFGVVFAEFPIVVGESR